MLSDMPKTSDSPPVFPARMIGVMNAKLVPVIDNRPLPNPRNDITCSSVPVPLATSDMLMRYARSAKGRFSACATMVAGVIVPTNIASRC